MQNLNLLILNSDLPVFPGWGGIEYLHTTHLARLAHKVGLVSQVHTREQHKKKQSLTDAGVALYLWESPNLVKSPDIRGTRSIWMRRVAKIIYSFVRTWPRRPQDTLIQDFQFRNMSAPLLQALNDEHWQVFAVVQSSGAYWLDYLSHFPVSVLMMHDARARVYERRIQTTKMPHERLAYLLEAYLYRRFERLYCHKYDLVITVSSDDEDWVRAHYQPNRVVTIPIPVDANYFAPMPDVSEAKTRIVFTGMMNHPPNVDAASFFAQQIFPQVRATIPEAEFWVVGRDPTPEVTALANLPGVVVTGFVPDIRLYIAQATVMVVPLRFGAGMRQKILEAWAMQKCVVSTQIGAEGLDYQDQVNILIADEADTIADRVIQSIQNRDLRDKVRIQGRALITKQHNPDTLAQKYYEAIASVVREKRQQGNPMHAVIDLRWMQPGVAGGIENLSRSFLDELLKLDRFNTYTVLVPVEASQDFDLRYRDNFRIQAFDGPGHYWSKLCWRAKHFFHRRLGIDYWRSPQVESLKFVHDLSADVVLSLSGYIFTDMYPFRNTLIFADLQHEYHPEFFSPEALEERKRVFGESISQADYLIAISEYTRQTVLERYEIDPNRTTTLHLAANPRFHPENWRDMDTTNIIRKYNLPENDYLFFPANTWSHKNHCTALEALATLRDAYHLTPLLALTGAEKEGHPALLESIQRLGLDKQVRFLGYCPADDMPALYRGASALFFPSLFEGFGIPLLEAMWCQCPIVCSNTTSLPELAGEAALLVDPRSPEALAEAISRVLTNTALRHTLIERGCQQVKKFSWQNFTLQTVRILHQVRDMH